MTTPTTVNVRLQLRADTAANWTAANPILLANEVGLETDTKKLKVGNGSTAWNSLAYFPSIVSGGTVLGNLEIGSTGTLTFEGSTADGFETTLAVTNPTADRTITLPNQSGTVVVSGNASIVDADIAANAEIAVSKLADGAARQLLQTDAAGTGVEWTSNVDIPGTLDVTGTATFDGAVTVAGDLTVNGTTTTISTQNLLVEDKNIILGDVATPSDTTADGGGITLKGATDKTINWVDSTDAWTSSERFSVPLGSAASPSLTFTGDANSGLYSPGAGQVAISTNSAERMRITATGVGIGTSSPSALLSVASTTTSYTAESFNIGEPSLSTGRQLYMGYNTADGVGFIQPVHWGTEFKPLVLCPSGGRVGIGTTAPSYALDVRTTGTSISSSFTSDQSEQYIALKDSGTTIGHVRLGSTSGSMLFFAGNGERGRFDSSGRLLVGTSTAVTGVNQPQYARLQVIGNTLSGARAGLIALGRSAAASTIVTGEALGGITFGDNAAGEFAYIFAEADGTAGTNDYPCRLVFSVTRDGQASPTSAMRITNSGRTVVLGNTNAFDAYSEQGAGTSFELFIGGHSATTTAPGSGTSSFRVFTNGNVQNTNNSYGSLSDAKLKENIVDAGSQWNDLKSLQVRKYNFKEETGQQTHTQIGLIAQEVEQVSPGLVSESPDRDAEGNDLGTVTKSVNYSVLYMKAVKALQEAMERIEVLEQRLTDAGIA